MNEQLRQFLALGIDLTPLGVEPRDPLPYFCTPQDAEVFGWTGVDGSHFCFIPDFGDTVFAVSPMEPPNYVHPVARDFRDFLRLLLACGHAISLEQAWACDEATFYEELQADEPYEEQQEALNAIAARTGLTPMEQPLAYLHTLLVSFDPSSIPYTEEYYDLVADDHYTPPREPWKVSYRGNFWGHQGSIGTELPIGQRFDWANHSWYIPSVYLCEEGLVIDFCMQADAAALGDFLARWAGRTGLTREDEEQMALENPLHMDFSPELDVNGQRVSPRHGCAVGYLPCPPEGEKTDAAALRAVAHYELDEASGWWIHRCAFPGTFSDLETLAVHMVQDPAVIPGPHFRLRTAGDSFAFTWQGRDYTLSATQIEQQELPQADRAAMRRPVYFTVLQYRVTPEIKLSICDCAESDASVPDVDSDAIGVIGGADGPTVLILSPRGPDAAQAVCSALHNAPVEEIEWRIRFPQESCPDMWVSLR